ncbi:DUF3253 domain-containing protein [Mongoliitalea daihaiensis]|nr:DUF3253 domain-containing protein [Mongoliitalea daihaiensis]
MEPNPLRQAIFEMIRMRHDRSFCPSEVVRWIFPQDWELFMQDVREEMMEMYREGLILVTQKGNAIDPSTEPKGPVRISRKK